jgi:hypothetical protein
MLSSQNDLKDEPCLPPPRTDSEANLREKEVYKGSESLREAWGCHYGSLKKKQGREVLTSLLPCFFHCGLTKLSISSMVLSTVILSLILRLKVGDG